MSTENSPPLTFGDEPVVSIVILSVLIAAGFVSTTTANEWSGKYWMEGTNPDGSEYIGNVQIEPRGDGYLVTWLAGGHKVVGQGVAGEFSLAVGAPEWIVIYEKADNGVLVGSWLPSGKYTRGFERLIPVSD